MENKNTIPLQDLYFVVVTKKYKESIAFYQQNFGFEIAFGSSWFTYMQSPGERPFGLAIMGEDHPTAPPKLPPFQANAGAFLTLQVEDAKATFEKLKAQGATFTYSLHDEPWGQRRFSLTDPNGLFIDVVQQIEPKPGYWDKYMEN